MSLERSRREGCDLELRQRGERILLKQDGANVKERQT